MSSRPSIFEATLTCRRSLEKCLVLPPLMIGEWAENRLADFNLWCTGAGALAKSKASLDHRLKSDTDIHTVVVNLLRTLNLLLETCCAQALKDEIHNGPKFESLQSPPEQMVGEASIVLHPRAEPTSSPGSLRSDLDENIQGVEETLRQIVRLTLAIRKSGTSSRFRRADNLFDPEEHRELEAHLHVLLIARPSENCLKLLQVGQYERFKLTDVQKRLVEANLRRRNRFLYAQKHAEKLKETKMSKAVSWSMPRLSTQRPLHRLVFDWMLSTLRLWFPKRKKNPAPSLKVAPSYEQPTLSQIHHRKELPTTSASKVEDRIQHTPRRTTTIISTTAVNVDYPNPPVADPGKEFVKCPCCCQSLEISIAAGNRWRNHLAEDIQPYTCVLEQCPQPWDLFESQDAWIEHIKTRHGTSQYWRCPDTDCSVQTEFDTEEEFTNHVQLCHPDSISEDDLPILAQACFRFIPVNIRVCPLCPSIVEGEELDDEALLDHIAEHVHSFSLRSLPWAPREEEIPTPSVECNKRIEDYLRMVIDEDLGPEGLRDNITEHIHSTKLKCQPTTVGKEESLDLEVIPDHEVDNYFRDNMYFSIDWPESNSTEARVPLSEKSLSGLPSLTFETPEDLTGDKGTEFLDTGGQIDDSDNWSAVRQLRKELHAARIESPADSYRFFVPESDKAAIITEDLVTKEILAANVDLGHAYARSQASLVLKNAKNVFAILAYLGKGSNICELLQEGISDSDLPFLRSQHKDRKCAFSLQRSNGDKIEALEQWDSAELEFMGWKQWDMLAPVFKDMEHLDLHKKVVLPLLPLDEEEHEQKTPNGSEYSEIFTRRLHAAHHQFHYHWTADKHPKITIKRLLDNDKVEFEKERDILTTLGRKTNVTPHLVRLLATFKYGGMYHLIFPRANCNLREYWSNRPEPSFNRKIALWSLQQMAGIAQGLNTIHNFRVIIPLDVENKVRSPQHGVKLSVEKGEGLFGRHGDIKPENILWFEHIPGYENDGQGILQITDFGLGRFHGRDSRTEQYPHGVFGSPTYEPPECKLHRPVTRTYDLWSLGCLYLEFATWLLIGFDAIEEFSEKIGRPSSLDSRFSDDYFFTVIRDEGKMPRHAKVREGVVLWARTLHENEKCSKFIHDVVDLVMDDLLRIDARDRIPASWLCVRFGKLLEEAGKDPTYLCTPYRRSPGHPSLHTSRSNSELLGGTGSDRTKGQHREFVI